MYSDTHCHLNFEQYDQDRSEVIDRAITAGITKILNPGIDLHTSRAAVSLAHKIDEVYAAIGVHPNSSRSWMPDTQVELKSLASSPKVVAVGEIGLDYYRDWAPIDLQNEVFRHQLHLAAEINLPVVIHMRDRSPQDRSASQGVLEILKSWHDELVDGEKELSSRPGVLHSFSSELEIAQEAIAMNFLIGITGPVTFQNAERLRKIIKTLPVDHLLLETDGPFLTPHPFRGQRNEPAYIPYIAQKLSEIYEMNVSEVEEITMRNSERLFRW